jgi:drug/metabolite transporter (DMT)-like permease
MNWIAGALLSTLLFSLVSILDKRLISNLFPNFTTFNITFALLQLVIAATFFIGVIPTVGFDGGDGIAWAAASGLLWAIALSLIFYALSIEEVSRVAPMQSATPVFTAIIAVTLFDDVVTPSQWVAILVIVSAAVMINLRRIDGRYRIARGKAFVGMMAAALVLAMAFIVSDEATDRMNIWATQGFRALFMGFGILVFTWRPNRTALLVRTLRDRRTTGLMVLTEGMLGPLAALSFVYALSVGPVSLVTTVTAVRPLAVLIISAALSTPLWNFINEPLKRETIAIKLVSTVLIVGGVITLGL